MRWPVVTYITGILLFALGLCMLPAALCAYLYDGGDFVPLILSGLFTTLSGAVAILSCRDTAFENISQREGMAIVAVGWTVVGIYGALPFYFSGAFPQFVDAFFESVSGFTTTGSSVLTSIETVPKGILFWRSLIQWLGGMGIIVLSLAILPFLGVGGMQLYKAEVPSPVPDKLKPRLSETASILWKVYALISVVEVVLLLFGGMSFYDALCHTFTTMPTGGFSTKNASVAGFNSTYIDVVIIVFMVLAGINFSLHYQMLRGKTLAFWQDAECRWFLIIVAGLSLVVSLDIHGSVYKSFGEAFRYGSFQVVSIITTTGYATADYELWPGLSQVLIFLCMFIGASAGSTGGGMKVVRVMLCMKYCYRELYTLIHPRAVSSIKLAGKAVSEDVMRSIIGFIAIYIGLFGVCSVLLAGMGVDFVTAFTAVGSCIGNIGPGFGLVGPAENFALIPSAGKWILIWCMLLGRLEIYTVIIFLVPEFWRK
ncbi:MAG: TrkH family potassium uptake protein [Desulfobacterales bacterium]|nr:TrkH family potassium uptake protein [Desulfobacterales bacterium]